MTTRCIVVLSLFCLLFALVASADLHRVKRQSDDDDDSPDVPGTDNNNNNDEDDNQGPSDDMQADANSGKGPRGNGANAPDFTTAEFAERLNDILDRDRPQDRDRPEHPWGKDRGKGKKGDLKHLLRDLEHLADRTPDSLDDFDAVASFGKLQKEGPKNAALNNTCLKTPASLLAFMKELHKAYVEFHEDVMESEKDDDDDDSSEDTTPPAGSGSNKTKDDDLEKLDIDDILEELTEASMVCMTPFFDDDDKEEVCEKMSHQSANAFSSLLKAGIDCTSFLDDEDDELDEAHQKVVLAKMLEDKQASAWTSQDLQRAISLAADEISEDLIDDIDDDVVFDNLDLLGRVASRRGARPGLQLALGNFIKALGLNKLVAANITKMGYGLMMLSVDDLEEISPEALLGADLDDIFEYYDDDDDDDDPKDKDDKQKKLKRKVKDDDDDFDDDEGKRLAIGRRIKQADLKGGKNVGRAARHFYYDGTFLSEVEPEDLLEGLEEMTDVELDEDEAGRLFERISKARTFPHLTNFTRNDVKRMRSVMAGISLSQLEELPTMTIRDSIDELKDLEFGESQARELLHDMFDEKPDKLTAAQLRGVGQLARGLGAEDIEDLADDVVSDLMGDLFDDLDLNEAQKRMLAAKALKASGNPGAAKLLTLAAFAETLSITDIEDSTDDDVVSSLNVSAAFNWRASQAAILVKKLKSSLGGQSLRPSDIPHLGMLVRGLLPRDLDDITGLPDDVDDLVGFLDDLDDDLSSAQVDKIVELIEDRDDMGKAAVVNATAAFVARKGIFLAYLSQEMFKKLEFDDDGKKAMTSLLVRLDTSKMPRVQLAFLAEKMIDMIEKKSGESDDDSDYRKLRELGGLALGLSKQRLMALNAQAVLRNLGMLGTLPFTREQAEAILEKVEEAMPDWECKSTVFANLAPLLQFAPQKTIDDLCDKEVVSVMPILVKRMERWQERLEERREQGSLDDSDSTEDKADDTEDDDRRKMLVAKMLAATAKAGSQNAAGRRRRAAEGELTCSVLRLLKKDVVLADVGAVVGMADKEFRDCLEVIGNATKWADKDITQLMTKTKQVLGESKNWTNEQIRQVGVLVSGLTPAEILALKLTGVDAMNSVGRHARLSQEQLMAGFSRWLELKKSGNISKVTEGEFSAMSEFVCGLTIPHIRDLPIDVYKRSLDVIGRAVSCSETQKKAYALLAFKAFQDFPRHWPPAVVGDMGHLIGGHSTIIEQLSADQIALVRPTVIAGIPPEIIKVMTTTQLGYLSTSQANSLTNAQYSALSADQQNIVRAKATVQFPGEDTTTPKDTGTASDSHTDSAGSPPTSTTTTTTTTTTTSKPTTTTTTTTTTPNPTPTTTTTTTNRKTTAKSNVRSVPTTTATTTTSTKPTPAASNSTSTSFRPRPQSTVPGVSPTEDVVKVEPTTPDAKTDDVAVPSGPESSTATYVRTTTRKVIAVSSPSPDTGIEVEVDSPPPPSPPEIGPEDTPGENPWVKFSTPGDASSSAPGDNHVGSGTHNKGSSSKGSADGQSSHRTGSGWVSFLVPPIALLEASPPW